MGKRISYLYNKERKKSNVKRKDVCNENVKKM